MNKGFTLVELLVVILIIGILSVVALPQYTDAVERSRASEAMINAKAIMDAMQRFKQLYPGETVNSFANLADMEIKGVSSRNASNNTISTKNFTYELKRNAAGKDQLVVTRNLPVGGAHTENLVYRVTYTYTDNGPIIECAPIGSTSQEGVARICKSFENLSAPDID